MNGDAAGSELPELTDEDVGILDIICKRAARSTDLPARALFDCYDQVLKEEGTSSRHDPVLFRWISRLSEPRAGHARAEVDFVRSLRVLLEAHGITVVDDTYDIEDTEAWRDGARTKSKRRVSFGDAQYQETWLSNHSHTLNHDIQDTQNLSGAPLHVRDAFRSKHARSLSQDRGVFAPRTQQVRDSTAERTAPVNSGDSVDRVYHPSNQEMEEQAEIFLETTIRRAARQCLHTWHATMNAVQHQRESDQMVAADNDYKMLLGQAFRSLRDILAERVLKRAAEMKEREDDMEAAFFAKRSLTLRLLRHFSAVSTGSHAIRTLMKRRMLAYRFFNRWKALTLRQNKAAEDVVLRKHCHLWMKKVSENSRQLLDADALYVNNLKRGAVTQWVSVLREQTAQQQRNTSLARQVLVTLSESLRDLHDLEQEGRDTRRLRCLQSALQSWRRCCKSRRTQTEAAADFAQQRRLGLASSCIKQYVKLIPRLQELRAMKDERTIQRALFSWSLRAEQQRLAAQHAERRVLNNALVGWNDKLRVNNLSQRINTRLASEMLYKLMLEERSRLCIRLKERRLKYDALSALISRSGDMNSVYERRSTHFAQESRRRKLTTAFQHMLLRARQHEDAERAANELSHARLLPGAWVKLSQAQDHVRELSKWSRDAAFYVGTKKVVIRWQQKTSQSIQEKRRLAYDHVRSRIKSRLMHSALAVMREKSASVTALQPQAVHLARLRSGDLLRQALLSWQQRTIDVHDMHIVAEQHDVRKLCRSALLAIETNALHIKDMTDLCTVLRAEHDLDVMAATYKRLRSTGFALARLDDSSVVFHNRLQERHRLQMLRHFAQLATSRRIQAQDREPDSPSIRPASRAASRSENRPTSVHKRLALGESTGTPAYLRTPSRAKRAKFKAIPTPAPFTPFAFTPAYLTDTPAPQKHSPARADPADNVMPHITPLNRKLRAVGVATDARPASILRSRPFGRGIGSGTDKSVRFASRFQRQLSSSLTQEI